ncbi:related to APN1-AP endonuclease [Sporisorium reilianum SRZ2]|uniref:Related to APN1-AP endonuclease n=1 Tax=Sporisorium reilianum (strain SRZ2) TaxID=999809 RepID=E6ZK57_SPORE|nr:related to APN1-AP endonuclease [Sporisorium reilianum SRZ2]
MPPKSKAMALAVESFSSTTLRRSSRRSVSASVPSPRAASTSSSVAESPSKLKRSRVKAEPDEVAPSSPNTLASTSRRPRPKVKSEDGIQPVKSEDAEESSPGTNPVVPKKRRTKKEAQNEDEIFPPRPSPLQPLSNGTYHSHKDRRGSGLFIGAHISSAGGVENAPINALRIGGNAFSCFVRPKMQWASNPIPESSAESFKHHVVQHGYMPLVSGIKKEATDTSPSSNDYGYVVPHGCYLVNLANPDEAKREKSFEAFIDDLQRCEQLGIRLFNFHPGSMTAASASGEDPPDVGPLTEVRAAKADACALVASYINPAHAFTSSVVILIENMAGSKNDTILGSSLRDLAAMISGVTDKSRVGVCIDTCHAFAAGYDLTSPTSYTAFTSLIDQTVGWQTVRAFHLNDSKFPLGCKRDRHANIGRGHIGLGGFWSIVNDDRWNGIPLILETPALGNASAAYPAKEGTKKMHEVWSYQIQALYALRGTKWGEWKVAEEWLRKADEVVEEAERLHAAKKGAKGASKKPTAKAKKKKEDSEEGEDDSELSDGE